MLDSGMVVILIGHVFLIVTLIRALTRRKKK